MLEKEIPLMNAQKVMIRMIAHELSYFTGEYLHPETGGRYDLGKYPKTIQLLRDIIKDLIPETSKSNNISVKNLIEQAHTKCTWDFATAMGDTIKEKYESLYIRVTEMSGILRRKTGRSAEWLMGSLETASIFEVVCAGFAPALPNEFEPDASVQSSGTVNNLWKLYKCISMPANIILMGSKKDPEHCAVIKVDNFIII